MKRTSNSLQMIFFTFVLLISTKISAQELFKNINQSPSAIQFNNHYGLTENQLLFSYLQPQYGFEPCTSDGTKAGTAMIKDVFVGSNSSSPTFLYYSPTQLKSYMLLQKSESTSEKDREIAITDLTEGGTEIISETGIAWTNKMYEMDGIVYWVSKLGFLWRSDGTKTGTYSLKDLELNSVLGFINSIQFVSSKHKLVVSISSISRFYYGSVWETDGTTAGTKPLSYQNQNLICPNYTNTLCVWKDKIYFMGTGMGLYQYDNGITTRVKDLYYYNPDWEQANCYLAGTNDKYMYFVNRINYYTYSIIRSDGTESGTSRILTSPDFIYNGVVLEDAFLFPAQDSTHGLALWKADDTGIALLKDINEGTESFLNYWDDLKATIIGNEAYFFANDSIHGTELWKSDGTAVGTQMVKDICTGSNSCITKFEFYYSIVYQDKLYFVGQNAQNRTNLFVSDGTEAGTFSLTDSNALYANIQIIGTNQTGVFFFTSGLNGKVSIYKTNGQVQNTTLYVDLAAVADDGSFPDSFVKANNLLFFTANDGVHGTEIWKTDATTSGTQMVKDIIPANNSEKYQLLALSPFNNQLFFLEKYGTNTQDYKLNLWKSDGTEEGTMSIWQNPSNFAFSYRKPIIYTTHTHLFFFCSDTAFQTKIVASNGNSTEVIDFEGNPVKEIIASPTKLYILTSKNGILYQIWESDGTQTGTQILVEYSGIDRNTTQLYNLHYFEDALYLSKSEQDTNYVYTYTEIRINPATKVQEILTLPNLMSPKFLHSLNGKTIGFSKNELMYLDNNNLTFQEIVQYNDDSLTLIADVAEMDGYLYFTAFSRYYHSSLYRTDGTLNGTSLIKKLDTIAVTVVPYNPTQPIKVLNHNLYFGLNKPDTGTEWWTSDGTTGGTKLMKDLYNGETSGFSNISAIESIGDKILFSADDGYVGSELWQIELPISLIPDKNFIIFPNPCSEKITIQFTTKNPKLITICNTLGQIVYEANYQEERFIIDIQALPTAVYYLHITDGELSQSTSFLKR